MSHEVLTCLTQSILFISSPWGVEKSVDSYNSTINDNGGGFDQLSSFLFVKKNID